MKDIIFGAASVVGLLVILMAAGEFAQIAVNLLIKPLFH